MANKHGEFIWYELMTRDPEGAKAFYQDILGWKMGEQAPGGMDYRLIAAGDDYVGGVLRLTDEMCEQGGRPIWMGYVGVDDVDSTVSKLESLGGSVLMPANDIPGVGRMAMVADPQGIPFYVMRGAMEDETSTAFKPMTQGHCAWNELTTKDQSAALDFYGALFGWENKESMPMGEMGDYQFLHHHGEMIGAVSPCTDPQQQPGWTYYFAVEDIDKAEQKIKAGGGQILLGPLVVPGESYIIVGIDPQEATFAVVGPRKK